MRRYRSHLFILSSNNTYVSVPFLSLGSSTVRSNPLQSNSPHCKINRSSWPNKTQISEKKYEAIRDHAYKSSEKTQIIFMDKSDHKLTIPRIPTNTPQKELHHMDLQETIVSRNQREIESHLASNYGPEGLQRTTHASSERHQWRW